MNHPLSTSLRAAAITLALIFSASAWSQQFIVSTGAAGNTYDTMVRQLATACQSETDRPIIGKPSSGSMENVDRLVNNVVPAAIVQTDVLTYRSRQDDLSHIKVLFALHAEEVHVLALSETRKVGGIAGFGGTALDTIADLRDRKVGAWGGSFITAQVIRLQSEIGFNVVELPDEAAGLKALNDKSVDALLSVGGSPQAWVQRLDRKFRLLPIAEGDAGKLKSIYRPAKLSYGNLGQTGVPTVATDAVLVARDYKTPGLSAMLSQTRFCFERHLVELQETPGNHPKWQTVSLETQPKWPRYTAPSAPVAPTSRATAKARTKAE